jgi:hypothetical protein
LSFVEFLGPQTKHWREIWSIHVHVVQVPRQCVVNPTNRDFFSFCFSDFSIQVFSLFIEKVAEMNWYTISRVLFKKTRSIVIVSQIVVYSLCSQLFKNLKSIIFNFQFLVFLTIVPEILVNMTLILIYV